MGRFWLSCLAVVGGVALLAGCDNKQKDEVSLLTEENQTLRTQLDERNRALDASDADRRQQALRVADLERQLAAQPASSPNTPTGATGFEGIEGVTTAVGPGEITATVEGDVLFDSGKTTLKASAKKSLDQIAQVLKTTYAGKEIVIEGHTDTDPIKRSGFKTNYHLGFERAFAVREFLISKGVTAERISLSSFGPNQPLGSKAKSRRVEVVVKQ
ncbi:MAG: OmpA family protein [Phycisphaerales bacterium]|nr:OmpA family protein [Phycisphaerales bacterium]